MTRMAMAYSPGGAMVVALYKLPTAGLYLNSPTILWPYYSRRRVLNMLYRTEFVQFCLNLVDRVTPLAPLKFTGMLLYLYTRHVIWINNQCCPNASTSRGNIHAPGGNSTGQRYRGTWPAWRHPMHSRLIFGPNAILSRSNIYSALRLLISQALTSLSFRH